MATSIQISSLKHILSSLRLAICKTSGSLLNLQNGLLLVARHLSPNMHWEHARETFSMALMPGFQV